MTKIALTPPPTLKSAGNIRTRDLMLSILGGGDSIIYSSRVSVMYSNTTVDLYALNHISTFVFSFVFAQS